MGLPEVADFARNFAVMVRVQGPDPKGLKMRNQAFHHYNSGRTTLSASGMFFMGGSGTDKKSYGRVFVLTVASVIEPFLLQQYRDNTLKDKAHLIQGAQIDILVESKSYVEGSDDGTDMEPLLWQHAELLYIVDIPVSATSVQSLIEASRGSMENGWEVGWSLASHSRGQHIIGSSRAEVVQSSFQSQSLMWGTDSSNPSLMGQSVTRIAMLEIPFKHSMMNLPKLQTSLPKRGDLLLAMGSPFGILSPVHFFDNISIGSVGNTYPSNSLNKSLLMADIRCLPGMEGSPIFDEHAQFVGLLTRPLRQKMSGTEVQLVIPWEAIASSCSDLLQDEPHLSWKVFKSNNGSQLPSPVEKAMSSICLITTGDGSWASGILLNKKGLVLTNAHLLEPWRFGKTSVNSENNVTKSGMLETFYKSNQNLQPTNCPNGENTLSRHASASRCQKGIRVRLDFMDPWLWTDASLIYISKGPLDIALLQIELVPNQLCPIVMNFSCPSPGSKTYVIGHGLFGPRCDFLPSVCFGVISKVIEAKEAWKHGSYEPNTHKGFPAMLETTATVHPGSSGGAVVNADGCMIGLATSNAKHGGGTVIPHLNFSIPCAALEPVFKFSKDMEDFWILDELDKPNEHLSSVWALMPPLYPKLAPLLPELPQIPSENNNKVAKGSRFSKFIAERNELLKKTPPLGNTSTFSSELIRSKL